MGRSVLRTILSLTVLAFLAGCAQDEGADEGAGAGGGAPASASPTPSPETEAPAPSASVAPATGKYLELETGKMRAPEGWTHDALISTQISAKDVDSVSWVAMGEILFVREAPLEEIARDALSSHKNVSPRVRRLPDRTLDGVEVYHFAGIRDRDEVVWYEEFGAMHQGMKLTLFFHLDTTKYTTKKERAEFIEGVLATFEWA